MILYILYRIGYFIANAIPVKVSYGLGCLVANAHYYFSAKDRSAVLNNLRVIDNGRHDEKELRPMAREVFGNFAKYLVDFFRFHKIDQEYINKFIKIDGLENLDKGLSGGKGVIVLSAHMGNWELGGFIMSLLRNPLSAVVLTHKNKRINDFFRRQRTISKLKPVEIGMSLRSCYNVLKTNGLLALLGDRDFSNRGLYINFFGKKTLIPKGPAAFSCRMGSCIVPTFMIREKDDTFRLIMEPPIYPDTRQEEKESIKVLVDKYSGVIESYVRKYPTQWYMFREVWNGNAKTL